MITTYGEHVNLIKASEAIAVSSVSKYTPNEYARADIMLMIYRSMNTGQDCVWCRPDIGKELDQEVIDWLVSLGYMVWHNQPHQVQWNAPSKDGMVLSVLNYKTEFTYSIYWRFPVPDAELADSIKPFAPGERWWDHREDNAQLG
jgi:hypothetical protein